MKREIDNLLAQNEKLQEFLGWLEEKSCSVEAPYKLAAVRAYYFDIARTLTSVLATGDLAFNLDLDLARAHSRSLNRDLAAAGDLAFADASNLAFDLDLDLAIHKAFSNAHNYGHCHDHDSDFTCALDFTIALALSLTLAREIESTDLQKSLQQLKDRLPNLSSENYHQFEHWWKVNGQKLTEQLRAIMIQNRNIGHDWQFRAHHKFLIQEYYDATNLLVDCLNSDCYISREVRAEIEASLLLPIRSLSSPLEIR